MKSASLRKHSNENECKVKHSDVVPFFLLLRKVKDTFTSEDVSLQLGSYLEKINLLKITNWHQFVSVSNLFLFYLVLYILKFGFATSANMTRFSVTMAISCCGIKMTQFLSWEECTESKYTDLLITNLFQTDTPLQWTEFFVSKLWTTMITPFTPFLNSKLTEVTYLPIHFQHFSTDKLHLKALTCNKIIRRIIWIEYVHVILSKLMLLIFIIMFKCKKKLEKAD